MGSSEFSNFRHSSVGQVPDEVQVSLKRRFLYSELYRTAKHKHSERLIADDVCFGSSQRKGARRDRERS